MNDFTKDELQKILECVDYTRYTQPFGHFSLEEIYKKLQSMINNYCEHEKMNDTNHCVDCGVSEYTCTKCGYVSYEGLE